MTGPKGPKRLAVDWRTDQREVKKKEKMELDDGIAGWILRSFSARQNYTGMGRVTGVDWLGTLYHTAYY